MQLPTAVLSTTARAKARAAKKEGKTDATAKDDNQPEDMDTDKPAAEGEDAEATAKEAAAAKQPEPTSFTIDNPARVVPHQRKFVSIPADQRFQPIKPATAGFVVLRDTAPGPDIEYLFVEPAAANAENAAGQQENAGAAAEGNDDHPPAPAPFEYVPS